MPLISFFGVICIIPFMYIIIVYLVFISSIAKGLAMSRLGGTHGSLALKAYQCLLDFFFPLYLLFLTYLSNRNNRNPKQC